MNKSTLRLILTDRAFEYSKKYLAPNNGHRELAGTSELLLALGQYIKESKNEIQHAQWLISSDGYYPYCSLCKQEPQGRIMTNYCPNCGTRMDGDKFDHII